MILTITLNPSIDISVQVNGLLPDDKLRCEQYEKEVGGGGINVAKGLARLGLETHSIFFAAGLNGKWIKDKLHENHLHTTAITSQGETRENISIRDLESNKQYRLVNKGDGVNKKHEEDLLERIHMIHPQPTYVILSGSMPRGISASFVKKLAEWCSGIGARLIMDLPADELKKSFRFTPYLIKPNLNEFLQIAGHKSLSQSALIRMAQSWIEKKYAHHVAISMDKDGGILVSEHEAIRLKPPRCKVLSTVGAGDSMVAGLTYQMYHNASLKDTLRLGLACGTAATLHEGTKLFDAKIAWRLFKSIK